MKKLEAQLNKTEVQRLRAFLAAPERPQGTFTYEQACGFLFAIAASPELVLPSEWLPLIFNGEASDAATLEEAQDGTELLMVLYNQINQQIGEGRPRLPEGCDLHPDPMQNLHDDAPFSGWAQGFVEGHNYLEALWDEYTPESLDDELGSCLVVLSFFSSPALAQAFYEDSDSPPPGGLEAMAVTMHRLVEEAMISYAHIGRAIYQALLSEQKSTPLIRDPKVSRNDPCPCGSGRKYKHCCLH